jgi:hypothetical protein
MTDIATCIGCGCDDFNACEDEKTCGPCHWLAVDYAQGLGVCSACEDDLERWNKGDREMAVPGPEIDDDFSEEAHDDHEC